MEIFRPCQSMRPTRTPKQALYWKGGRINEMYKRTIAIKRGIYPINKTRDLSGSWIKYIMLSKVQISACKDRDIDEIIKSCTLRQAHQIANTKGPLMPHYLPKHAWHTLTTNLFHLNGIVANHHNKFPIVRKVNIANSNVVTNHLKGSSMNVAYRKAGFMQWHTIQF